MDRRENIHEYVSHHRDQYIGRLRELCEEPGVSATGNGMAGALQATVDLLSDAGFKVTRWETAGYPVVLGTKRGTSTRTLGIYGHYDVQPAEPIEAWNTDPFRLTPVDGRLFARGVADTKGHLVARLCAIEAYEACLGSLPVEVKILVEGEEEIGSPHLADLARDHQDDLDANGYLWESGHNTLQGEPTIYLGMKGMLALELRSRGARNDLHSMYAPIVPNPLWQLAWAVGAIQGDDYHIRLPGFYDAVRDLSIDDIDELKTLAIDMQEMRQLFGLQQFVNDLDGLDALKQFIFAPACTINGWWGGHAGKGHQTVVPSHGGVKLDFRLVPDQDPEDLKDKLQAHLAKLGLDVVVSASSSYFPARTDRRDPLARALIQACGQAYGRKVGVYPMLPASGPMYELCQRYDRAACGGAGVIRPDSNVHGPNENIRIDDFLNAIVATVLLLDIYGRDLNTD